MNPEELVLLAIARERETAMLASQEQERLSQPPSTLGEVVPQAVTRGITSTADVILNTPENLVNLAKAGYGTALGMMGAPASALPEVVAPPNRVENIAKEIGLLTDLANMTPRQRLLSSGIEGGVSAMMGGPSGTARQLLTDVAVSGLGSATGQAVSEATGSPLAGLAASVAVPTAGSAVPSLNIPRTTEQLINQELDRTINEAKDLGFLVMPEGRAAVFAGQDTLQKIVEDTNQKLINNLAKESIGFAPTKPLNEATLNKYREDEYNKGYAPFMSMRMVDPDMDYLNSILSITQKPLYDRKKMQEMIKGIHTRGGTQAGTTTFDPQYLMQRVKELRSNAQKNLRNEKDAEKYNLGRAEKELADALEDLMERQLIKNYKLTNRPEQAQKIIDNFRESRKNIAVSHVIEDVLERGSGRIMLDKLAESYQKGAYLTGNLEKAAKFANVYKFPEKVKSEKIPYGYVGGIVAAGGAAPYLGLDAKDAVLLAGAAALTGRAAQRPLQKATQEYLLSRGQARFGTPDYTSMGINPRMAFPSAVGMFSSMQDQPEENQ